MMFARRDRKRKIAGSVVRTDPGAVESDSDGQMPIILYDIDECLARLRPGNGLGLILLHDKINGGWSARSRTSGDSHLVLRYSRRCQ